MNEERRGSYRRPKRREFQAERYREDDEYWIEETEEEEEWI